MTEKNTKTSWDRFVVESSIRRTDFLIDKKV